MAASNQLFLQKGSIKDVWQGPKYAFAKQINKN